MVFVKTVRDVRIFDLVLMVAANNSAHRVAKTECFSKVLTAAVLTRIASIDTLDILLQIYIFEFQYTRDFWSVVLAKLRQD